jgi:hypothetical protein
MTHRLWFRWFNHLRAFICGYFWKACPVCGQMFGGHEFSGQLINTEGGNNQVTCPACPGDWVIAPNGRPGLLTARWDGEKLVPVVLQGSSDWHGPGAETFSEMFDRKRSEWREKHACQQ